MSDCLFCKILADEIPSDRVYEDDQMIVFKDINPKAEVHLLVIPREHIDSLNELEPQHDALVGHMLRQLPKIAKQQGLDDGFRTIINTGEGGGQIIFHLHIHLMGGKNMPGFE
ncbi:histidine triad nucleotide-binding protein [Thiohalophilus sp.]|uniref:histidine triad nucleotide-binding protein n=1 Tax=Thiohalophilus sp. TaxID=3028392 RepID=UPI002ACE6A59|nr:histidine triad nucleotide-binding protein [Thiohalophilus sp.]MDZ7661578.1 histidine triad nucleotide-binding protein [Thiohalophilus sp.]